jgi:hypothetical protein
MVLLDENDGLVDDADHGVIPIEDRVVWQKQLADDGEMTIVLTVVVVVVEVNENEKKPDYVFEMDNDEDVMMNVMEDLDDVYESLKVENDD